MTVFRKLTCAMLLAVTALSASAAASRDVAAPLVQREAPLVQREAPLVQREAPLVQREAPLVQREAPLPQREALWAAVSRDDAAAMAQRETGGRVLAVERADSGGRAAWRVKVLTPRGDVRVVLIDMATGQSL